MNAYVALLRGVNVSGKNKIKMAEFRSLLEEKLGFNHVETYIQSGNILFQANRGNESDIAGSISEVIKKSYGYDVPVWVYSHKEFTNIYTSNNFISASGYETAFLHTTLFHDTLPANTLELLEPYAVQEEELNVGVKCIYLYAPNGYGKTKLSNTHMEKKLGTRATTRNWKTMTKLKEMMDELALK